MWRRILGAFCVVILAVAFVPACAANEELVAGLKKLGTAVDNMSANISNADSDASAETLANVTQQALDNGLKDDRPWIQITASAGRCRVTIETAGWKLWSEADHGKIVDHGANISQ
jgi:hypothetical protein